MFCFDIVAETDVLSRIVLRRRKADHAPPSFMHFHGCQLKLPLITRSPHCTSLVFTPSPSKPFSITDAPTVDICTSVYFIIMTIILKVEIPKPLLHHRRLLGCVCVCDDVTQVICMWSPSFIVLNSVWQTACLIAEFIIFRINSSYGQSTGGERLEKGRLQRFSTPPAPSPTRSPAPPPG